MKNAQPCSFEPAEPPVLGPFRYDTSQVAPPTLCWTKQRLSAIGFKTCKHSWMLQVSYANLCGCDVQSVDVFVGFRLVDAEAYGGVGCTAPIIGC